MPARPAGPAPASSEPPFYVATEDLYLGGDPGMMPVAAYRKGDRVKPSAVKKHQEWAAKVAVPEQFKAPAPPPPSAAAHAADKE